MYFYPKKPGSFWQNFVKNAGVSSIMFEYIYVWSNEQTIFMVAHARERVNFFETFCLPIKEIDYNSKITKFISERCLSSSHFGIYFADSINVLRVLEGI